MARALRRAGFDVVGCDANPVTVEQFVREGGQSVPDPASAAADVDIVICVVANAAQTEAVLLSSAPGAADRTVCETRSAAPSHTTLLMSAVIRLI